MSQPTMNVWVKVGTDQPIMITCKSGDYIDTLKVKIKEQLAPDFDQTARHKIIVKDADGVPIEPDIEISTLNNNSKNPFLVDAPAPKTSTGQF